MSCSTALHGAWEYSGMALEAMLMRSITERSSGSAALASALLALAGACERAATTRPPLCSPPRTPLLTLPPPLLPFPPSARGPAAGSAVGADGCACSTAWRPAARCTEDISRRTASSAAHSCIRSAACCTPHACRSYGRGRRTPARDAAGCWRMEGRMVGWCSGAVQRCCAGTRPHRRRDWHICAGTCAHARCMLDDTCRSPAVADGSSGNRRSAGAPRLHSMQHAPQNEG